MNSLKQIKHLNRREKMREQEIQSRFERETGYGHQQVQCGIIDILTPFEIIEIKNWDNFDTGIGQLFRYSVHYPKHQKRLHCFGSIPKKEKFELYKLICQNNNILLTYEDENIDIKDKLLSNVPLVFSSITNINDEIEAINTKMSSSFEDYVRICLNDIKLTVSNSKNWDLIIKYDGYPLKFEPKDDVRYGELMKVFEGYDHILDNWNIKLKVMGQTSLYIKVYTDGNIGDAVEEMIRISKDLCMFEVALPILVVRDENTKEIFGSLFLGKDIYVYTINEIVEEIEVLTNDIEMLNLQ